jgi:hypothetical protein
MTSGQVNVSPGAATPVTMERASIPRTDDQALWVVIRNAAENLSFDNYASFIEPIMCGGNGPTATVSDLITKVNGKGGLPFPDAEPYRLLKVATEVFLMAHCGVVFPGSGIVGSSLEEADFAGDDEQEEILRLLGAVDAKSLQQQWNRYLEDVPATDGQVKTLPYLYDIVRLKLGDLQIRSGDRFGARECYGILMRKLTHPCLLELIWNYWHEEGMLIQSTNAISWRFQNRRSPTGRDPLAGLEIDPLRALNGLLWGLVQDEQNRLTIPRRAYEYDHEYGLKLVGKAVPEIDGVDSRSRFIEGFHNLLMLCSIFYKEDDDTTVVADGFPVLNGLREVHLQLTQGAHNQYGGLPWTARIEFLMYEWLLARPEMREFLPRRVMVDYPEPWMDSVESMKGLQGWTDTSILHFRDLGIFGEKILLSIRWGAWTSEIHPEKAANWARYWRAEIQGYLHAYRAATGADLTAGVNGTQPSILLRNRIPNAGRPGLTGQSAGGLAGITAGRPTGGRRQIEPAGDASPTPRRGMARRRTERARNDPGRPAGR